MPIGERARLIAVRQRLAEHTENPPGVHPGLRRAASADVA